MSFLVQKMDSRAAAEITTWRYYPPYDIYNIGTDKASFEELMNGTFFAVYQKQELVGYYCLGAAARIPWAEKKGIYDPDHTDIGLAMRPDLTGKGMGLDFFHKGLELARDKFPEKKLRLTVAAFNQRASTVYNRAGFMPIDEFTVPSGVQFIVMVEDKK